MQQYSSHILHWYHTTFIHKLTRYWQQSADIFNSGPIYKQNYISWHKNWYYLDITLVLHMPSCQCVTNIMQNILRNKQRDKYASYGSMLFSAMTVREASAVKDHKALITKQIIISRLHNWQKQTKNTRKKHKLNRKIFGLKVVPPNKSDNNWTIMLRIILNTHWKLPILIQQCMGIPNIRHRQALDKKRHLTDTAIILMQLASYFNL